MIEKQMIKLLLNKKFYDKYKGTISRNIFEGNIGSLFDTIKKAHDKYESDIKIDDLYSLHTKVYNPALTRAMRETFSELIEDIKGAETPNEEVAKDIIKVMRDRDIAQQIAVEATEIYNGRPAQFNVISNIIDTYKKELPAEQIDAVTNVKIAIEPSSTEVAEADSLSSITVRL